MKQKPAFFNKKRVESIPNLDKTHREEIKNLIKFCNEIEESSENSQYLKNYAINSDRRNKHKYLFLYIDLLMEFC